MLDWKSRTMAALAAALLLVSPVSAQPADEAAAPASEAPDADALPGEPEAAAEPEAEAPEAEEPAEEYARDEEYAADTPAKVIVHAVTTRGTFQVMRFDVYNAETGAVAAEVASVDRSVGSVPEPVALPAGTYKLVESGNPFGSRTDFLSFRVEPGEHLELLLIVDPVTREFRGGGPLVGELPTGVSIAGLRIGLNTGGTFLFNRMDNAVGATSGNALAVNAFANLGLVFSRAPHLLTVDSNAELGLDLRPAMPLTPLINRLEASAIYTYKVNNPYIGPYVRAAFRTQLFQSYMFFESDSSPITVTIRGTDGSTRTVSRGDGANINNLRLRVADPLTPFILQEGVGANLQAVDLDLRLVQLNLQTRLGGSLRHGFLGSLLVPEGPITGPNVTLAERDNYFTAGPELGAVANVKVTRWLFGQGSFMMLYPLIDRPGNAPIVEFAASAGLRLSTLASFNYSVRLEYDAFVQDKLQVTQLLGARVNWNLL